MVKREMMALNEDQTLQLKADTGDGADQRSYLTAEWYHCGVVLELLP